MKVNTFANIAQRTSSINNDNNQTDKYIEKLVQN